MAKFKAYYGVDFNDFDLNHYRNEFDSQELVENSKDKSNAGSDDRYSIWTTEFDKWAVAFHGYDFDYGSAKFATEGTVEAFSEWFYNTNPDEEAGEEFGATRIYLLKDIDVALQDFIDVLMTNRLADDADLLSSIFSGDDNIKMSHYDDRAYGYGGNDSMKGYRGNDVLYGDAGDDTVKGNTGNDKVYGGSGNDRVTGDSGNDKLWGNQGDDDLKGGNGDDNVRGGDGADIIRGARGRDKVWGQEGDDTFDFRTGDDEDIIQDWETNDTIDISNLDAVLDWTDLTENHMSQVGSDVVIDAGDGDILTLKNTLMESLLESHFIFQEPEIV